MAHLRAVTAILGEKGAVLSGYIMPIRETVGYSGFSRTAGQRWPRESIMLGLSAGSLQQYLLLGYMCIHGHGMAQHGTLCSDSDL
jgi:hypothetical protein